MISTSQNYGMIKMPKMQKISDLLLISNRDDQLAYFTMLTPIIICGNNKVERSNTY
jgi:hypothetical protein